MKKKLLNKLKPLQEFFNYHNSTLFNSKVVGLSKVSLEGSTVDQSSVGSLDQVRVVTKHRQVHSTEASKILPSSGQSSSEDETMFQNLSTWSTPEHQVQDVFDCQGDDSSGVNEGDEVMISGDHFGGADYTNVTSSTASVSNSCPDVLEKSLIGKCITNCSSDDHVPVEEGDNNSMRVHSSEAILRGKGLYDELNFNSPIASVQNHYSQNQNELHGDESEELVDVRVCDVCGDVGREMLLALCCQCGDGAEHIYCMNPAMDKVPESDWLCEECLLIQEPKRHQLAVVERSESADDEDSEPSCSTKLSQSPLRIYTAVKQVGKTRKIYLSKSSGLSNKKLEIDASMKTKKRTIDQRVQALKIFGSGRQTRTTQVSSLKNTEKKKDSADQVSSFVDLPAKKVVEQAGSSCHSSLKPEQQFCGGSLNSLEVQCSWDDIHQSSSKENPAGKLKKKHPDKKVSKSLSCAGVGPIPLDMSNTQSSTPTIEGIQCESGNNTEKRSKENKASQVRQTRVVSKIVKRANIFGKNVKDKMNGNTSVKPLGLIANKIKNYTYTSGAGSVENKKLHSHLSCVVNSSDVNGDSDQRVSLSPQKVKIDGSDHSRTSYKILPIDSQDLKVMPTLDPANVDNTDLSAISVVPESKCIWKGMFKLDKSGKLSSDCYGVQAHLSTRASPKVEELIIKFSSELQLREVPRVLTWPIQFQKNQPTEQDIALYFFAQDFLSYQRSYWKLLEVMTSNDLALEANFGGFQLLVFPSRLLPEKSQRWNSLPYLWGVFRARKLDFHFPNLNISPLNQRLGTPVTCGSESKLFSPSVPGSAFASHISQTTMEGTEFVDPVVLQSSASMKFRGQSSEHEVPSLPEAILKVHHVQAGTVFCDGLRFEGFYRGVLSDELQEGRRFYDENVKSVSNVDIFRCGKSMTPVGLCSDVVSSRSLDSGPSGLSDSEWCAKSANEEPFEKLGSYNNDLNLDLCLGNRSEDVNLDLALGFPSQSAYQPEDYLNRNNQNEEISLVLSLGMPCC